MPTCDEITIFVTSMCFRDSGMNSLYVSYRSSLSPNATDTNRLISSTWCIRRIVATSLCQ